MLPSPTVYMYMYVCVVKSIINIQPSWGQCCDTSSSYMYVDKLPYMTGKWYIEYEYNDTLASNEDCHNVCNEDKLL